jgi:pimeloyl-ACP methyl ester carboxylesterase
MSLVEREGVGLFFTDDGNGMPVLLHTGGGGDGRMWELAGYTRALSGFRRLVLDHRGHGRSDRPTDPGEHRIGEYVADVLAVLDAAQVERAAIVGYSAGASVAYAVAAAHPDRVSAVAALGNVPVPDLDPTADLDLAALVRSRGMRALMEELAAAETEPAPAWLVDNLADTPAEMFALLLEAWADEDSFDDLTRIACPTLLVCGELEQEPSAPSRAAGQLADGRAVVLPGFGHLQTFWHGEVTAPIVVDFLGSLP